MSLMSFNPIDWGKEHGARVSDSIAIGTTSYGGRGLFAVEDIEADKELLYVPGSLQLGVGQLAEGEDAEMQKFVKSLPWRDILASELTLIPCAISIIAAMRDEDSFFHSYLQTIPTEYTNAMANLEDDDSPSLTGAPLTAAKVISKRRILRQIHQQLAPSLPLQELSWASAVVSSRAFSRRRPLPVNPDRIDRIGPIAAVDSSRFLPLIDITNHGGKTFANADVRHRIEDKAVPAYDPHSTSLISTRGIQKGEEILIDYGGGRSISNERLLMDYGFIIPDSVGDTARLRFNEDLIPALQTFDDDRRGMTEVSEGDLIGIRKLAQCITMEQKSPILFDASGKPSLPTMVLTLVLSCRGVEDVARIIAPVRELKSQQGSDDVIIDPLEYPDLLLKIYSASAPEHQELAFRVLRQAASLALQLVSNEQPEVAEGGVTFEDVARDYCRERRHILQRAALLGPGT